jgi:hypothetical protein
VLLLLLLPVGLVAGWLACPREEQGPLPVKQPEDDDDDDEIALATVLVKQPEDDDDDDEIALATVCPCFDAIPIVLFVFPTPPSPFTQNVEKFHSD